MQIVIFGATGSLGTHIVQQALTLGYSVTAFTRHPRKLESITSSNLQIVKGEIHNLLDVENAVRGKDAVLCALGDGSKGQVRAAGTYNIIKAMNTFGCQRLVCQTTLGLGESWHNLNFFWKHIMFGFLLKKAFQDHQVQESHILSSTLNYTIVRPSAFTDGKPTHDFMIDFDGSEKNLKLKITRADVADFMLKQLTSDQFSRAVVSISK